jgi:DNA-binding CsgD family transcriptional regulator
MKCGEVPADRQAGEILEAATRLLLRSLARKVVGVDRLHQLSRTHSGIAPLRGTMHHPTIGPLPLVGRSGELAELRSALDEAAGGHGSTWLMTGPGGVGKTRLARTVIEEAHRRGWLVASGGSFPVESGVPYALFTDALQPVVRRLDDQALLVLTRGVGELTVLFPSLTQPAGTQAQSARAPDFRSRLHWHFTELLRGLAAKQPVLVVLEDLQWADTSSMDLLHFIARHIGDSAVVVLCTANPEHATAAGALRDLERAIRLLPAGRELSLTPLSADSVEELICRAFRVDGEMTRSFALMLFGWTRGNPFFIEETLKLLVASGELRLEDERWTGWDLDALQLPQSVRDAVLQRLDVLSPAAREAADIAAVIGGRFGFDTLRVVVGGGSDAALAAIDELCSQRVLHESEEGDDVLYDFVHPIIRETLYRCLSRTRARMLHGRVAAALEARYGAAALDHADQLAYHFVHASFEESRTQTTRYLAEAGRRALAKYANREAADYLSAALERAHPGSAEQAALAEPLARARQRLGDYSGALQLWERVRDAAVAAGDTLRAAGVCRRMGLACYWTGDLHAALEHFDHGLRLADGREVVNVRLLTARAVCLQELGRPTEALETAQRAAAAADEHTPPAVLARVHRTFLQLHLWLGDGALARQHGALALELARESGDRPLAFLAHWTMGVLHAFSGEAQGVEDHLAACRAIAEELRAPVLRVWAAELALEYASARGDWAAALQVGEEAIRVARSLHQGTLLPRLLVWTALLHGSRGDQERAAAYVEEAWRLSGADNGTSGTSIHAVLPAYIGRVALRMNRGEYREAVALATEALRIADDAGYVLWAVHRLLPMIAESQLWLRDLDGALQTGQRLRRDAARLGHGLGLAWAGACEACVVWLRGDSEGGAVLLRRAAEQLEAMPFIPDATRLRRQLAGRLADIGDREGALAELRLVHDRLLQLGAEQELRKARQQFREIGARPPARAPAGPDTGAVTKREMDVASLVAHRKSSKAIARDLRISVRTVDAHLTNIYRKLNINSRTELADLVRSGQLAPARGSGVAPVP